MQHTFHWSTLTLVTLITLSLRRWWHSSLWHNCFPLPVLRLWLLALCFPLLTFPLLVMSLIWPLIQHTYQTLWTEAKCIHPQPLYHPRLLTGLNLSCILPSNGWMHVHSSQLLAAWNWEVDNALRSSEARAKFPQLKIRVFLQNK